jgi:hypothetical protein
VLNPLGGVTSHPVSETSSLQNVSTKWEAKEGARTHFLVQFLPHDEKFEDRGWL